MKFVNVRAALLLAVAGLVCAGALGCAGTKESASADKLTANVGNYSPAPNIPDEDKPQVGVPRFEIQQLPGQFLGNKSRLEQNAADQMTTLLAETDRFNVVERAQVEQLLKEQDMEGIVRPDQMAKAGEVLGTDYLLLGKVTNFRVKQAQTKSGVDVGGIGGMIGGGRFGAGSTGFDKKNQSITTEVGVDIRLVDSTTGRIAVSKFSEFNRTDSAGAMGISVFGVGGSSDASITIEEDDAGRILRLAFDDALKKALPDIDRKILANAGKRRTAAARPRAAARRPRAAAVAEMEENEEAGESEDAAVDPAPEEEEEAPAPARAPAKAPARNSAAGKAPAAPANAAAGKKFCAECGEQLAAGVKFCAKCGAKAQ